MHTYIRCTECTSEALFALRTSSSAVEAISGALVHLGLGLAAAGETAAILACVYVCVSKR